jgi:hypothetical protein
MNHMGQSLGLVVAKLRLAVTADISDEIAMIARFALSARPRRR